VAPRHPRENTCESACGVSVSGVSEFGWKFDCGVDED
jgi:hypothetical protein